ncbi:MAG: hypothetical protein EBY28_11745 [Betaproteobacteria bacterium]|nr:hypothetical protein [Betaproteobacteria bacterium]
MSALPAPPDEAVAPSTEVGFAAEGAGKSNNKPKPLGLTAIGADAAAGAPVLATPCANAKFEIATPIANRQ